MSITIVGDIHGRFDRWYDIMRNNERTLAVGDIGIGFKGYPDPELGEFNAENHKFIRGNHDNPHRVDKFLHFAGDYGMVFGEIFVVGGASSIDYSRRKEGRDWWVKEELDAYQRMEALQAYSDTRPAYVVSHDCPESIRQRLLMSCGLQSYPPSHTQLLLEQFLWVHIPKVWIFGHYHRSFRTELHGCEFVCLNELEEFHLEI